MSRHAHDLGYVQQGFRARGEVRRVVSLQEALAHIQISTTCGQGATEQVGAKRGRSDIDRGVFAMAPTEAIVLPGAFSSSVAVSLERLDTADRLSTARGGPGLRHADEAAGPKKLRAFHG